LRGLRRGDGGADLRDACVDGRADGRTLSQAVMKRLS
jgi:hypothetical protein